jgi:SAM-dependent methyltransferase
MRGTLVLWARSAYHGLEDIGLQPLKLLGLRGLPAYLRDLATYRRLRRHLPDVTDACLQLAPLFSDRYAGAGAGRSLYFLQDLLCSSRVLSRPSVRHLDIGSRIDGFVAQIAASRPIEVLDIRPLERPPTPNLRFLQGDILDPPAALERQYDLVSSLHALEHVGLGRYGDPIAPDGFERALANAAAFVAPGGSLLISLPVAEMERNLVQFNSQRLFAHARLADLLGRLLPAFSVSWCFVIDATRIPRQHSGDPAPLLGAFRGFGLCGVELRRE